MDSPYLYMHSFKNKPVFALNAYAVNTTNIVRDREPGL